MEKYFRIGAAALAWFAILLQYYRTVTKPGAPFIEATVRYFSFFTILTNLLVALALTLPWLAPDTRLGAFFTRPSVRTAILTYIIIVAVIYHYLLAKLWNPQGWHLLADTIEHVVTPALYAIDWVLFVPKGTIRWKSAFVWLVYPLGYAVYSLIHGAVTGFYPYPFNQCRRARLRQDVPQYGRACTRVPRARPRTDRHRSPHGPQQQRRQGLAHSPSVSVDLANQLLQHAHGFVAVAAAEIDGDAQAVGVAADDLR